MVELFEDFPALEPVEAELFEDDWSTVGILGACRDQLGRGMQDRPDRIAALLAGKDLTGRNHVVSTG